MIQKLEKEFTGIGEVKGFRFSQKIETEHAYLYEVSVNGFIHYEVIKRVKSPICIDFKNRIYSETEFKEYYPKANSFGQLGWQNQSFIDATNKILTITKK